jgi:hypothetical protein
MQEMSVNFAGEACLSYYAGILTCREVLRRGDDGFISPPKEGVLRGLSPLKIHLPRPGLNQLILGPVASTITTRPPRTT